MDKKDLVITAITNYNFNTIAPWVNSLDRSGFTGLKVVIAYNIDHATLECLTVRGYNIIAFQQDPTTGNVVYPKKDFAIVVERFLHYYLMLDNPANREAIRYVIATDAKDVIFQKNPSEYLNSCGFRDPGLVVSSEGIEYEHEIWGLNNLIQSFGPIMCDRHKNNTIINCGVLAGSFEAFMGLCESIYLLSMGAPHHVPGGGGPDQAALNLLMDTFAYKSITTRTDHSGHWAAQLGTMMDPNKLEAYRPHLKEPLPVFNKETGLVENSKGEPFTIVHQWDRVPEVREAVLRLYQ